MSVDPSCEEAPRVSLGTMAEVSCYWDEEPSVKNHYYKEKKNRENTLKLQIASVLLSVVLSLQAIITLKGSAVQILVPLNSITSISCFGLKPSVSVAKPVFCNSLAPHFTSRRSDGAFHGPFCDAGDSFTKYVHHDQENHR